MSCLTFLPNWLIYASRITGQLILENIVGHFRDKFSGKKLGVRREEASMRQDLRDGHETLLLPDGDHLPNPEEECPVYAWRRNTWDFACANKPSNILMDTSGVNSPGNG